VLDGLRLYRAESSIRLLNLAPNSTVLAYDLVYFSTLFTVAKRKGRNRRTAVPSEVNWLPGLSQRH
jgi:hypothetical protein